MSPKHRTTVYVDHEIVMIAKARKINMSETLESVLRSMIGEIDPEARKKELENELRAIEMAMGDRTKGPLALEIKDLRDAYKGAARERYTEGETENWMQMRIREFPHIRARFTIGEAIDLARED